MLQTAGLPYLGSPVSANRPSTVAAIDVKGVVRAWSQAMAEHAPDTLQPSELRLDREALTRSPKPLPVYAWVRYGRVAVRVAAHSSAWTKRATAIRWLTPTGEEHKAWVWASAVESRREDPAESSQWISPSERGRMALQQAAQV